MFLKSVFHRRWYSSCEQFTTAQFEYGIKKITLSHAKSRNSLSIAMMESLVKHISTDWDNSKLRVVVIAGSGGIFSAGHNLKELSKEAGIESHRQVFAIAANLMQSIIKCPVPVIAAVDGLAAAAGCQLVAQADLAVCTNDSQFSTPGINFGIFCSTPGVALARAVPKATAMKMLLTGAPITAKQALSVGLVSHTCEADQLDSNVAKLCASITEKSRSVVELGKRFYYQQIDAQVMDAYNMGGDAMVKNLQLSDGTEGIRAFVEKRKPLWSHE